VVAAKGAAYRRERKPHAAHLDGNQRARIGYSTVPFVGKQLAWLNISAYTGRRDDGTHTRIAGWHTLPTPVDFLDGAATTPQQRHISRAVSV
jgi:hypothetical protein